MFVDAFVLAKQHVRRASYLTSGVLLLCLFAARAPIGVTGRLVSARVSGCTMILRADSDLSG